jgi:hypothetical protein
LVRRAEERSDELLFFFVIISSSLISVVDSLRSLYRICRKRCAF